MSSNDGDASSEDWLPRLERPDVEHFKWAWNEAEGEIVWEVSGPGDGRPFHEEQMQRAWGRMPSSASGDVLGGAAYTPPAGVDQPHVSIYVYSGTFVPASIAQWFREAFPSAEVDEQPSGRRAP